MLGFLYQGSSPLESQFSAPDAWKHPHDMTTRPASRPRRVSRLSEASAAPGDLRKLRSIIAGKPRGHKFHVRTLQGLRI